MSVPKGDFVPPSIGGPSSAFPPGEEEKIGSLAGEHTVRELHTGRPSTPQESEAEEIKHLSQERVSAGATPIAEKEREKGARRIDHLAEETPTEHQVDKIRSSVIPPVPQSVSAPHERLVSMTASPRMAPALGLLPPAIAEKQLAVENGLAPLVPLPGVPITSSLLQRMRELNVNGVGIAVIDKGTIWTKGYGEMERTEKLSQVASISKVVTSLTVLSFIEQCRRTSDMSHPSGLVGGVRIDLDTDVSDILGEDLWSQIDPAGLTRKAGQEVTIRRLLSHTAGISHERYDLQMYHSVQAIDQQISQVEKELHDLGNEPPSALQPAREKLESLRKLRNETLKEPIPTLDDMLQGRATRLHPMRVVSTPGTTTDYSNAGFMILQKVIEVVTGRNFEEVVHDRVLGPLGMRNSTYSPAIERTINGNDETGKPILGAWCAMPELAAGGLWSNVEDQARLIVGLQGILTGSDQSIIGSDLAKEMMTGVTQNKESHITLEGEMKVRFSDYGLGIGVEKGERGPTYVMHDGAWDGFQSFLITNEEGLGAVILANADKGGAIIPEIVHSISEACEWNGRETLKISRPKVSAAELSPVPDVAAWFDRVKGRYTLRVNESEVTTVDVCFEGGKVVAKFDAGMPREDSVVLTPLGEGVAAYPSHYTGPYDVCRFTQGPDGSMLLEFNKKYTRPPT